MSHSCAYSCKILHIRDCVHTCHGLPLNSAMVVIVLCPAQILKVLPVEMFHMKQAIRV